MSDYQEALEAAGAKVLEYEYFGDYQGTWIALVDYNGQRGFVEGSFGSCSGCDAFQAEFDYDDYEKEDYQQRLSDFGKGYLDPLLTFDQMIKSASTNIEWDYDAKEMLEWVKDKERYFKD